MKSLLLLAALLTVAIQAHALPVANNPVESVDANAISYEQYRKAMVESAPNYETFLQWATPAEIAADAGVELDETQVIEAADGDYKVHITIDVSSQSIEMTSPNGVLQDRVATARPGYRTPRGCFRPTSLQTNHWSKKYKAWMPHSVFFYGGAALHQGSVNQMSHGCVHLSKATSLEVYDTVQANRNSTLICVQN